MNHTPTTKEYFVAAILVFLGAVLVSTKAIFVKLAYQYSIDSASLLTLRMAFSFPIFLIIAIWSFNKKKNRQNPLTKKELGIIMLMGMLGYYLASLFDFMGLQYISASFDRYNIKLYCTFLCIFRLFF